MFLVLAKAPMSQQCSNMLHVMMQYMYKLHIYMALLESAADCFCIQLT